MKFFLDSAKIEEIEYALEMWDIDGVTTNPRHVQVSGKPFLEVIQEIGKQVSGTDKTISVEVNPHHTDFEKMVAEGKELAAFSPNFVIKLPATEAGFKAVAVLKNQNIPAKQRYERSTRKLVRGRASFTTWVMCLTQWVVPPSLYIST